MTVFFFYYPATWVKSKGAMKPKWQDSRRYEFTQCWFGLPVYWRELCLPRGSLRFWRVAAVTHGASLL